MAVVVIAEVGPRHAPDEGLLGLHRERRVADGPPLRESWGRDEGGEREEER